MEPIHAPSLRDPNPRRTFICVMSPLPLALRRHQTYLFAFISRASFAPAAMSLVLRFIASRRQYKITFFLSAASVDSKFRRSLWHEGWKRMKETSRRRR